MIQAGQVTGARALQEMRRNSDYLLGREPKIWSAEFLKTLQQNAGLESNIDTSAAVEASSQMQLELSDIFTLKRDFNYSRKSRRALYTRAYRTKQLRAYEMWRAFAMENQTADLAGTFLDVDPNALSTIPYATLLNLPVGSTKLAQVQKLISTIAT